MYHAKKQGNHLSNTINDTSTITRNSLPGGITHDCASIVDSIAIRFFAWYIPSHSCLHLFHINAVTRMRTCIG